MRRNPLVPVLLLLGSLSCGTDDPAAPSFAEHPLNVSPAAQWAGGTIHLTSAAMAQLPDSIQVVVDGAPQFAQRIDDSSFATVLSDTLLSGIHTVAVPTPDTTPEASVTVAGHRALRDLGMQFSTDATPWPHWSPTGLIGGWNDTLVFLDLATGTTTNLGVPFAEPTGIPGVSFVPEHLILPRNDTAHVFSVDAGAGSATPAASPVEGVLLPGGSSWDGLDQLSDSVVAFVGHDAIDLDLLGTDSSGTHCNISAPVNGARVILSPRMDRAGFPARTYACGAVTLVPIFDTHTGESAFQIPGSSRLDALEFSTTGTTAYAITRPTSTSTMRTLYRLDATTGAVFTQVDLLPDSTDVGDAHLRFDPTRERVYETSREGADYVLRAWDGTSMARLASVRVPGAAAYCQQPLDGTWSSHLVVASDGATAWLVIEYCHGAGDHAVAFTFDLVD